MLRSRDQRMNLSRVSHSGINFPRWRLRKHFEPLTAGRWVRLLEAACWGSDTTFVCHHAGGSKMASTGHARVGQGGRPVKLQLADWDLGQWWGLPPHPIYVWQRQCAGSQRAADCEGVTSPGCDALYRFICPNGKLGGDIPSGGPGRGRP